MPWRSESDTDISRPQRATNPGSLRRHPPSNLTACLTPFNNFVTHLHKHKTFAQTSHIWSSFLNSDNYREGMKLDSLATHLHKHHSPPFNARTSFLNIYNHKRTSLPILERPRPSKHDTRTQAEPSIDSRLIQARSRLRGA